MVKIKFVRLNNRSKHVYLMEAITYAHYLLKEKLEESLATDTAQNCVNCFMCILKTVIK